MYPYLKRDLENGILSKEEAFELLEEFFISFNRDSDLYTGMQPVSYTHLAGPGEKRMVRTDGGCIWFADGSAAGAL